MKPSAIDAGVRAAVVVVTLITVCYLAVAGNANTAQLAAGGLLATLAAAVSYEFRGRVQPQTPPKPGEHPTP